MSIKKNVKLLRITTSPADLKYLLAGQLGFFKKNKFKVMAASADGPEVLSLTVESLPHKAVSLKSGSSFFHDILALIQLIIVITDFKPDIVHTHSPKAGLIGMLASWICRVPVRMHTVSTMHDIEVGNARSFKYWMNKIINACASHVYPNARGIAEKLYMLHGKDKVRMIGKGSSNGVDTTFFRRRPELQEQADVIRRKYGIPSDSIVFSYVGKVVYEKGIRELVEAFTYCREKIHSTKPLYLIIVGPIEEGSPIDPDLLQFLTDDQNVILGGYQQEVRPWLMASDIFVFPSYSEGCPSIVMQASCLEIPSIVSDISGCNEIVSHNETGLLVKIGDPEALGEAMIHLAENEELRSVFGRAARQKVSLTFDQRSFWNELNNEYETLLSMHEAAKLEKQRIKADRAPAYQRIIKPTLDVFLAAVALIITSPVFIICAVSLAVVNKGKVFFKQRRPGKNGRVFPLLKFRTMTDERDVHGLLLPDELRLTPVGKFIRQSSLDELPQLINVLLGHMSLIGPRPLLEEYMPLYSDEQRLRHNVKPGITGWAQVNGRNAISWQERFEHDIYYVKNESLRLDMKILWMTMYKVFKAEGITSKTSATMEKFDGNTARPHVPDTEEDSHLPEWKISSLKNQKVSTSK